jgi:tRNA modification GTPase
MRPVCARGGCTSRPGPGPGWTACGRNRRAGWEGAASDEGVYLARARHLDAIGRAQAHLRGAADELRHDAARPELAAEELRLAQRALGEITGQVTADDILGQIFSRFCIGK